MVDSVQLAKRYRHFCSVPKTQQCHSTDEYVLASRLCDGIGDCGDNSDEQFTTCHHCGHQLIVSGSPRGYFDGVYASENDDLINDRPVYKRTGISPFYLYSWSGNNRWHFNKLPGLSSAYG